MTALQSGMNADRADMTVFQPIMLPLQPNMMGFERTSVWKLLTQR